MRIRKVKIDHRHAAANISCFLDPEVSGSATVRRVPISQNLTKNICGTYF